nr:zinc finger protein 664-like [Misgurnus anguillicaudatus]
MDVMCCKSGTDQDLQDEESTDQTSTESLDSVCNAGEQQQILQTKLNMCSVKLIDCGNQTEIKTEEENHTDDDDFLTSDVKSELCLNGEILSSTSKERHLERHERKHTEQKLFTCRRSEISFTTLQEKKLHSEDHKEKKKKKRQFHCQQCGKNFVVLSQLKVHIKSHSDEKSFYCTECGHYFSTKGHLDSHQRIHTGEKPYECPHCEKTFSHKHYLKSHVRIHTNERPYQCSECDKAFRHASSLKSHQKIHSEEKLFQCSHCDKRFCKKAQLIDHERIHTGEKPYFCPQCEFIREFTLERNLITVMFVGRLSVDMPIYCHTREFIRVRNLTSARSVERDMLILEVFTIIRRNILKNKLH